MQLSIAKCSLQLLPCKLSLWPLTIDMNMIINQTRKWCNGNYESITQFIVACTTSGIVGLVSLVCVYVCAKPYLSRDRISNCNDGLITEH